MDSVSFGCESLLVLSLGLSAYTYFVPVFAQEFGASFLDVGLIGTATALTYAVSPILAGYLSDRVNRAWLFAGALFYNAFATIALVVSRYFHLVENLALIVTNGYCGYTIYDTHNRIQPDTPRLDFQCRTLM